MTTARRPTNSFHAMLRCTGRDMQGWLLASLRGALAHHFAYTKANIKLLIKKWSQATSSPGLFPKKNGRPTHFLREKPWGRGREPGRLLARCIAFATPGPQGDAPIYGLYRYVPLHRATFLKAPFFSGIREYFTLH